MLCLEGADCTDLISIMIQARENNVFLLTVAIAVSNTLYRRYVLQKARAAIR